MNEYYITAENNNNNNQYRSMVKPVKDKFYTDSELGQKLIKPFHISQNKQIQ
jgi:hypothetical protein